MAPVGLAYVVAFLQASGANALLFGVSHYPHLRTSCEFVVSMYYVFAEKET